MFCLHSFLLPNLNSQFLGIPYDMGTIADKLVREGKIGRAEMVGKWDCGMATPRHTPVGRGYNTSLNYFGHGNYQWGMIEWGANGGGNAGNVVHLLFVPIPFPFLPYVNVVRPTGSP